MSWYSTVVKDVTKVDEFLAYYEKEFNEAKLETSVKGSLERNMAALPGITEHRFNQLQEIEAVLNFFNIQLRKLRRTFFQKYLENYNRALTSRDAEKYVDGEDAVIELEIMINEVSLIRNKYLGILKAIDVKAWQLGHITKLRASGLDDATIG